MTAAVGRRNVRDDEEPGKEVQPAMRETAHNDPVRDRKEQKNALQMRTLIVEAEQER